MMSVSDGFPAGVAPARPMARPAEANPLPAPGRSRTSHLAGWVAVAAQNRPDGRVRLEPRDLRWTRQMQRAMPTSHAVFTDREAPRQPTDRQPTAEPRFVRPSIKE